MNILIIRFSSMGDVVLASAVFAFLKRVAAGDKLWFCTDTAYAGLFTDDTRLERVVHCRKKGERALAADSRATRFDRIIDLQGSRRSRRLIRLLAGGAAVSVLDKKHFQRFLLLALRLNTFGAADHVVRRYCRAAGAAANENDLPAPRIEAALSLPEAAQSVFSTGSPVLALLPFSAWKNKEWPLAHFHAVGAHFIAQGFTIVILGGPQDAARAQDLAAKLGARGVSLAGKLSLYECATVLKRCRLALGNDTGLAHLARAVGVKAGIVFGSTTSALGFFPYAQPAFAIFEHALWCRPCHAHGGNFCLRRGRPCLRRSTPHEVIAGLERLLKRP